jgi:hypothetical protein
MSCFEEQRELCAWLEAGAGLPLPGIERARLAVHRNTFVGTLVEAHAESFAVSRALAGAAFFDAMARERVLAQPPRSPVLTEYLVGFPGFAMRFGPAQAVPVLVEMLQLESLRLRAFHAADADAVGLAEFQRLAGDASLLERTRVLLHPAAHWLSARHALLDLWQAHVQADDMVAADLGGIDADLAQDVLVHRPCFEVRTCALPAGGTELLDALSRGASLALAFAEASRSHSEAEPATLFSLLLREGLVVALLPAEMENP